MTNSFGSLVEFGDTGLWVSRLCFGTLTLGPLQANLPIQQGVTLLLDAVESGVNFFDTAQSYRTYPYLRELICSVGRHNLVIATKSYAVDAKDAREALEEAMQLLGTDYIDLFLLHEQISAATLRGHKGALDFYSLAKKEGKIRAIGISTHYVAAARATILHPQIDCLQALYNLNGFGIQDGSAAEMISALEENKAMGKGLYAMKVLGGGHLIGDSLAAVRHVASQRCLHSLAIGMQNKEELRTNLALLNDSHPSEDDLSKLARQPRRLIIADYCQGCGNCLSRCPTKALRLNGNSVTVDRNLCFTCGYCGDACPHLALKIV